MDGTLSAFEDFLENPDNRAAIMHSKALGRDFVFARTREDLRALTDADRLLPVLGFAECGRLLPLGLEGLAAFLDARLAFGASIQLQSVTPRRQRKAR